MRRKNNTDSYSLFCSYFSKLNLLDHVKPNFTQNCFSYPIILIIDAYGFILNNPILPFKYKK